MTPRAAPADLVTSLATTRSRRSLFWDGKYDWLSISSISLFTGLHRRICSGTSISLRQCLLQVSLDGDFYQHRLGSLLLFLVPASSLRIVASVFAATTRNNNSSKVPPVKRKNNHLIFPFPAVFRPFFAFFLFFLAVGTNDLLHIVVFIGLHIQIISCHYWCDLPYFPASVFQFCYLPVHRLVYFMNLGL